MNCQICGSPYQIIFYVGEGTDSVRLVDVPPELLILPEYIEAIKTYWELYHRRMPSGFALSPKYELATIEDAMVFVKYMEEKFPRKGE